MASANLNINNNDETPDDSNANNSSDVNFDARSFMAVNVDPATAFARALADRELEEFRCSSDEDEDAAGSSGGCEKLYVRLNNKRVLLAMALGIKNDDGEDLGDHTVAPYVTSKQKTNFTPRLEELKNEMTRRYFAAFPNENKCKNKNFNGKKCKEWLDQNPIRDEKDIAFLTKTVGTYKVIL